MRMENKPSKPQVISFLKAMIPLLAFLVLLGYSGCNNDDETEEPEPTETIYEIVQNTPELDSLDKYLQDHQDLISLINASGSLTLFAPDNDAFVALLETDGFPPDISLINPEIIKGVLFYHLVLSEVTSDDLTPGASFETAYPGEKITINDDGTLLTGASNKNIEIGQADIRATNGIIHTTKNVLIPPSIGNSITPLLGTVAGSILLGADFSTMAAAILRADSAVTAGQTTIVETMSTQNVTIFAIPNEAFQGAGYESGDLEGQTWRPILLYHMINGITTSENLTDRSYTSLMGEDIYVTSGTYINGFPIAVPDAAPAANGTIHVLAGILFPGAVTGGDIVGVANAQGFDSLAVALDLTGLDASLSSPEGPFTVFAPPNEAFVGLLGALGLSSLSEVDGATLQGILLHHVVPGYAFSTDLSNGQNLSTLAQVDLTVNISEQGISLTDGAGNTSGVVTGNIKATNGVIHVVGGILQPQ